ncbi:MAG: glutathione-disulfide reductase [Pseudomonadota bacterium]|nr:glutathione-disulfide reductase [Pseudomonadota bacterium]
MAFDFDLFVIGGGSGGVRAARLAAGEAGAKVGLAEEYRLGGTCVIRGCVPKKLMVFASGYPRQVEDAQAYGWDAQIGAFDWDTFKPKLHAELDRLEGLYGNTLNNAGVEVFDSRATLEDAHTVRLGDGRTFTAKHILVAVGGWPYVPEFDVADEILTSNEIFHLEKLPKNILIVGGGFIACEFACILNGMGVEVTQYYRGEQILRGFDGEARGHVAELMREGGVNLHVGTDVLEMKKVDGGLWVKSADGKEGVYEKVMYATGRRPNTANLGLDKAGVKTGRNGEIIVDEYSQTSVPSIYAVGDVTDRINLTPVAIREGAAFVETVFHGRPTKPDHELVASAVFTQPELGCVGLTEEQAREQEPIEVYATSFRPMQSLFAGRPDRVMMKLIVSQETRRVLGVHIVSEGAGELIQMAAIAVKMGATKEDFDRTVAVHPTMSEELVTMKAPVRSA